MNIAPDLKKPLTMIIGIDPGASGGIAYTPNWQRAINRGGYLTPQVMKIEPNDSKLLNQLRHIKEIQPDCVCFIEKVQMFKSDMGNRKGKKGADQKGDFKAFAIQKMLAQKERTKALMISAGIDFIEVHPKTWQARLSLTRKGWEKPKRKRLYKHFAGQTFPGLKATMWNADALCLVAFGIHMAKHDPDWIRERMPPDEIDLFS